MNIIKLDNILEQKLKIVVLFITLLGSQVSASEMIEQAPISLSQFRLLFHDIGNSFGEMERTIDKELDRRKIKFSHYIYPSLSKIEFHQNLNEDLLILKKDVYKHCDSVLQVINIFSEKIDTVQQNHASILAAHRRELENYLEMDITGEWQFISSQAFEANQKRLPRLKDIEKKVTFFNEKYTPFFAYRLNLFQIYIQKIKTGLSHHKLEWLDEKQWGLANMAQEIGSLIITCGLLQLKTLSLNYNYLHRLDNTALKPEVPEFGIFVDHRI